MRNLAKHLGRAIKRWSLRFWAPARGEADGWVGLEALEQRALCAATTVPFGAGMQDNSQFMVGSVAVTVVLLESDGTRDAQTQDWTTAEIDSVKQEIQEGLRWWEDTFNLVHPNATADLDFYVDWTHADTPVAIGYEPIRRASSDEHLWVDSFLDQVGYRSQADHKSDVARFNHAQRLSMGTNWAYTVFVVDSSSDADGRFADAFFAYAHHGGPFVVMTLNNGPWSLEHMGQVFAHETGHIFYALDEFDGSDSYWQRSGYYNTQNVNSAKHNPAPSSRVASLFAERSLQDEAYRLHTSSPSSFEMIGWNDLDADGILDVLDVPLTLDGAGVFNATNNTYAFTGTSRVNVMENRNPRGSGHDITLNVVDAAQYRLDGGDWVVVEQLGEYETRVDFAVEVPQAGEHLIEVRTVSRYGVSSNIHEDHFAVSQRDTMRLGQVLDSGHRRLSIEDADGTWVTVALQGPGSIVLKFTDAGRLDLTILDTNAQSQLKVTTDRRGDGRVALGDVWAEST